MSTSLPAAPQPSSYDDIPYDSNPFGQSHPAKLAAIGTLFGMAPPAPESARILELGCAAGGNILPIADTYPNSEVVGVDLSDRQVQDGKAVIEAVGLKNAELRHASISDIDASYGKFDYIICHGVYSWVPTEVQDHILRVCKENLNENGIAYISYNTFPGWHMRGMIRDMMLYHVGQFDDSQTKIRQARAVHKFLSENVPAGRNKAYAELLKSELDLLEKQRDSYLYHEHLEDHNHPCYFHEFADRAGAVGLTYLGEASLQAMLTGDFPDEVGKTLKQIAPNIIRMEQFMDFLRNRMFRQTLLVHEGTKLKRELGSLSLQPFYLSSAIKPVEEVAADDLISDKKIEFKTPAGHKLATNSPLAKIPLHALASAWPGAIKFDALLEKTLATLPADSSFASRDRDEIEKLVGSELVRCFSHGAIDCQVSPRPFVTEVSSHPMTTPLVRWQAEHGKPITNLRHENINVDEFGRNLLRRLDGTRSAVDLLTDLCLDANNGLISIKVNELQVSDQKQLTEHLRRMVQTLLPRLASAALLTK